MPPGVSGFVGIVSRSQRSVEAREPPSVVGYSGSAIAVEAVAVPVAAVLRLPLVAAWFPVDGAVRPFVVAGGPPLPVEQPENGAPQQPRARPRFPAASRAWPWRRPSFAPWPTGFGRPVATLSAPPPPLVPEVRP